MSEIFATHNIQSSPIGNTRSIDVVPGLTRSPLQRRGNIAIVGGTGFEELPPEIYAVPIDLDTPYGKARVLSLSDNYVEPFNLYFLSRHGSTHGLAPHQINYLANTAALVELGVTHVLATNAVGSLRLDLPPGSLVTFDDFIDFTRTRPITYFTDPTAQSVVTDDRIQNSIQNSLSGQTSARTDADRVEQVTWKHTDFSIPYSPIVRQAVLEAARDMAIEVVPRGTYVCCDGPRFESPAEVRLFAHWGGDIVGMTGLPEAVFAREAGIEYAAIGIVTNFGAGLTADTVDHAEVTRHMQEQLPQLRELLLRAAGKVVALTADS